MGEKDDDGDGLGLGLSLSSDGGAAKEHKQHQTSFKLNLMPFPSLFMHNNPHTTSLTELFQSSEQSPDTRSFQRGIDVNRTPQLTDCEDETGVSSPNSTISSLGGKRSEREHIGVEATGEAERAYFSRGASDDEDSGAGGDVFQKKLRLSKEQSLLLEETFKEQNTLNPKQKQKLALAKMLNLRPRQVEVWFQNRRARTKLKQTEVDCEYLKRCCDNLTQENRRLQKEVQELRTLKLSPQLYMHMNPPTTLTMCPSCERVSVSSSSSSSTATATALSRHQPRRPLPIKPMAALPVQHRPFDAPPSRS